MPSDTYFGPAPSTPASTSQSLFPTTVDNVADDIGTTQTIAAGGAHIVSTIDTIADQDFYKVELVAGKSYEIGQYAAIAGPSGIPLADAYIELYDADGKLVASADGGGRTTGGALNGLDALLSFTAKTSGTYYINARAFDNSSEDGSDEGDLVGDYELFVDEAAHAYQSYYDPDSPLHSIDWGTQVDGTARNPDGAEGPRPTGNAETGHAWNPYGIEGKNVITYYFAKQGEIFIDEDPTTVGTTDTMVAKGFDQWEKDAYLNAFGAYSKVADLVYVEVQDRTEADFVLITYVGTPGPGVSLLGRMSPPDEENEGRTEFNANDERWTAEGLAPGGFSFTTLIHELGHGHGLAHPHDNGGRSSVMRGVESDGPAFSYTNGDYDLNQSIYTMMSYEDGWEKSPYGQAESSDPYGWLGSLMAFDVAAIQDKYGVNEEWATGNDSYVLKDVNEAGTFYSCIWDAGGTDRIVYEGARDVNIDLRAATLEYEQGGGGWVSYAYGIHGGFTIANGVTIENGSSGSGNDTLIGNAVGNLLSSGAGNDLLDGGAGADRLEGGAGNDVYHVDHGSDLVIEAARAGTDTVHATVGFALAANVENLVYTGAGAATLSGNELANRIDASAATGAVTAYGGAGNDKATGGSAADRLSGADGDDILFGNGGDDLVYCGAGSDRANGDAGADRLFGDAGDDVISGGDGDDRLNGGAGADTFSGGGGADFFLYDQSSADGSMDRIYGFKAAEGDKVSLKAIDANLSAAGDQAFKFVGSAAFSGTAGELHLVTNASGKIMAEGDVNGDGLADFMIEFANPAAPIVATDFIL